MPVFDGRFRIGFLEHWQTDTQKIFHHCKTNQLDRPAVRYLSGCRFSILPWTRMLFPHNKKFWCSSVGHTRPITDKIHFPLHKNRLFFQSPVAIFQFAKDDIFQPDLASTLLGMVSFPSSGWLEPVKSSIHPNFTYYFQIFKPFHKGEYYHLEIPTSHSSALDW